LYNITCRDPLTLILDTGGNLFGGFTPLRWSSGRIEWGGSLKSFIFTLKNPHNIPARKFAFRAERKLHALRPSSSRGPAFGFGDMYVLDNCNANTHSFTLLGGAYTNDTGLDGEKVLTGSRDFQVREIEVFQITD
jgi:hypothetical protein